MKKSHPLLILLCVLCFCFLSDTFSLIHCRYLGADEFYVTKEEDFRFYNHIFIIGVFNYNLLLLVIIVS